MLTKFKKLSKVYKKLPQNNKYKCIGCTFNCCVEPNMSAIEFLYAMNHFQTKYTLEEQRDIIMRPYETSPDSLRYCKFYDFEKKQCSIYGGRPIRCRLFGIKSLDELFQGGNCDRKGPNNKDVSLQKMISMEKTIQSLHKEPKGLGGYYLLPFIAWFHLYFYSENRLDHIFKMTDNEDVYKTALKLKQMPRFFRVFEDTEIADFLKSVL